MQRKTIRFVLSLLLLSCFLVVGKPSYSQVPPNSNAYGKSLGEWMKTYQYALTTGAFNGGQVPYVGNVCLLPVPNGVYQSGSWTYSDPGLLVGHQDVTLKPGTPFMLTIATWYGEQYVTGAVDQTLDTATLLNNHIKIMVDGKTIIDDSNKAKFLVQPQYFVPYLPETPTGYGSIAVTFTQGFGFVHQPLSKGVHTLSLDSEIRVPFSYFAANPYWGPTASVNFPDGQGAHWQNTWTITVK